MLNAYLNKNASYIDKVGATDNILLVSVSNAHITRMSNQIF